MSLLIILLIILYEGIGLTSPIWHGQMREQDLDAYEALRAAMQIDTSCRPGEQLYLTEDPVDALSNRLYLMEQAQNSITLAVFEFHDDNAGEAMLASLYAAAERGVHVRILVDGMSVFYGLFASRDFRTLSCHPNSEIRIYNPVSFLRPWKFNYRMHDKFLLIDDRYALVCGRNISNAFLGGYVPEEKRKYDRDLIFTGDENSGFLHQFSIYVDTLFTAAGTAPCRRVGFGDKSLRAAYQQTKEELGFAEQGGIRGEVFTPESVTLLTGPVCAGYKNSFLFDALMDRAAETGEAPPARTDTQTMEEADVLIQSPYLVCDDSMYQRLTDLPGSKTLIINSVFGGSNPFGCSDYLLQKENVLRTGLRVYEYQSRYPFHAKMLLLGDQTAAIGSMNLDTRSAYLDTELMVLVRDPALNTFLRGEARNLMDSSSYVDESGETHKGENYIEKEISRTKQVVYEILGKGGAPLRKLK